MGEKLRTVPKPFRKQFITLALWILLLSALASLIIWSVLAYLSMKILLPANYYEVQLPGIYELAEREGATLLDVEKRSLLDEVVPAEGVQYRVVPLENQKGYGTIPLGEVPKSTELIRHLNQSNQQWGKIYVYRPLLNKQGELKGILILRYGRLTLQGANPNKEPLPTLFLLLALATPFLCLALFAFLLGRRLEKRFTPAVRRLMEGAQKIEQSDLDFSLGPVGGSLELTAIGDAFERMRATLRASLEKQWRSEASRREMVAALAHDLFTPLTLIQGHAERLRKGSIEEERQQRYVETIRSNSSRAIRLLEEMQEATRLELPTFTLRGEEVVVTAFVEQKASEYTDLCREQGIQLQWEVQDERKDPTQPLFLDEQRLSQVVDNLLANGLRYTPAGGKVRWKTVIKEGELEMEFIDSGPGLSAKDMRFLFDKFYRGDPARSLEKGHAGLGMYIAKTLVEKHDGWITADNAPEGGARFRLGIEELPREEEGRGVRREKVKYLFTVPFTRNGM